MTLMDQCSKTLQYALLALLLSACSSGLDGDDDVPPSEADALSTQTTKTSPCAAPDAALDAGTRPASDAGKVRPLSTRPDDLCGPAGEGDFPWGPCDTSRGLVCVRPDPEQVDEPATCQCPQEKVFTEGACVAR